MSRSGNVARRQVELKVFEAIAVDHVKMKPKAKAGQLHSYGGLRWRGFSLLTTSSLTAQSYVDPIVMPWL
jgi:hypothetical protein